MALRMGILGAARIAPVALVRPARKVDEVEVVAIAARDPARARRFAAKHGILVVHDSYDELLADDSIDAVYNPLPNGLHAEWTLRAVAAGKHVLCEKPLTSNASEAEEVAAVVGPSGLVVMEAFHYRYHPLAERMRQVCAEELGPLHRIETRMCIPLPLPGDIRYSFDLAGGAVMDVGCYAIHMARLCAGEEPEVVAAKTKTFRPQIDRWTRAELAFPSGARGTMTCALLSARLIDVGVRVVGEGGELRVLNPTAPQYFHRFRVRQGSGRWVSERFPKKATYTYQLEAFAGAVKSGAAVLTPLADSIANMRAIDAVYRAAGLAVRGA